MNAVFLHIRTYVMKRESTRTTVNARYGLPEVFQGSWEYQKHNLPLIASQITKARISNGRYLVIIFMY